MNRLLLVIAGIGVLIAWDGTKELRLSKGATVEPLAISLSEIEAGNVPDNPHLAVGEHWSMNHELVFSYSTKRTETEGDPGPAQRLDVSYYPIVATDNEYFRVLGDLLQLYGDFDSIPEERLPQLETFHAIVRTDRFATVGDLPEPGWDVSPGVTGMVANRVRSLSTDEVALIRQSFPAVDLERVLIIEEGRKPSSATKSYGMIGGGALVAIAPLAGLAMRARRRGDDGHDSGSDDPTPDAGTTPDAPQTPSTGPGPIA